MGDTLHYDKTAEDLEYVLAEVRQGLKIGDYDKLGPLTKRQETLLSSVLNGPDEKSKYIARA